MIQITAKNSLPESYIIGLPEYSLVTQAVISYINNTTDVSLHICFFSFFPCIFTSQRFIQLIHLAARNITCNLPAVHVLGGFTSQLAHVRRWSMAFARWQFFTPRVLVVFSHRVSFGSQLCQREEEGEGERMRERERQRGQERSCANTRLLKKESNTLGAEKEKSGFRLRSFQLAWHGKGGLVARLLVLKCAVRHFSAILFNFERQG